ncbi:uncharacterized protein LOC109821088 [Asparagus officinalis]|uniref:uncharacterized protein LOC109821088 n=1 Tax=Asparagus officinalis TaxID=4686 RepID=UPI00098E185D|nr:uncharacterized protein LOC109821088 [Asparagus officinalis]
MNNLNGTTSPSTIILDGKNYQRWRVQVKVLFEYQDTLGVVENEVVDLADSANEAEKKAHSEIKKKDRKALFYIHQEMEPAESIADYMTQVLTLTNQIKINREKVVDLAIAEKILQSLTEKFDHIVVAIEELKDLFKMTIDEFIGTLQVHEQYMNERYGHYTKECKYQDNSQSGEEVRFAQEIDDEENHTLLMVTIASEESDYNTWFFDTRCSNHIYKKKELFVDLDESMRSKVKFADDNTIPVMGKGRVLIKLKNRDHKFISDVSYMLNMKNNLLSMCQLLKKGYDPRFSDNQLLIFDKREEGIKCDVIFPYTPQHNSIAERKNQTILDMARSMLKAKGMPNYFLGEAISCAAYLLNRSPTKCIDNLTPEEAWTSYQE